MNGQDTHETTHDGAGAPPPADAPANDTDTGAAAEHAGPSIDERVERLTAQVADLDTRLDASQRDLRSQVVGRRIDRALAEAGAIDVEAAAALVERAVADQDEPDVQRAVRELRGRKPHLFRAASGASAMSGRVTDMCGPVRRAQRDAAESGDARSVMDYMRLRRTGA